MIGRYSLVNDIYVGRILENLLKVTVWVNKFKASTQAVSYITINHLVFSSLFKHSYRSPASLRDATDDAVPAPQAS